MYNKNVQRKYDQSKKGKARHDTEQYKEYRKGYMKAYASFYRKRRRLVIIKHYGNKCICCGEIEVKFLSIDHIKGGGAKHLREIAKSGHNFYSWILKNKFPKGFQVLCFNCNTAKGKSNKQFCPVHHPELYEKDDVKVNI